MGRGKSEGKDCWVRLCFVVARSIFSVWIFIWKVYFDVFGVLRIEKKKLLFNVKKGGSYSKRLVCTSTVYKPVIRVVSGSETFIFYENYFSYKMYLCNFVCTHNHKQIEPYLNSNVNRFKKINSKMNRVRRTD